MMLGRRIVLWTLTATAWVLATGVPLPARADCTGLVVGDFTYFLCGDGTSFAEQRIGDFVYLTGDVTGHRQQIGGIEYLHIDPPPAPPAVVPPPGASGAGPWVSWDLFGTDPLD